MRRSITVAATSMLIALTALAGSAARVGADGVDFDNWTFWQPGRKGLIVVRQTSAGAQISGAIKGLENGIEYRIIGTNEDGACSEPVTSANRTFTLGILGNTAANGTFFDVPVDGTQWPSTRFIRIREVGGAVWACRNSTSFKGGVAVADGAFSRFMENGELKAIVVVERRPNDQARVFVAAGDINGDGTDLSVSGSPKACGKPAGSAAFAFRGKLQEATLFMSKTVDMTQDELDGLRSIRIRPLSGGADQWFPACRKSILIGMLLP